MTFFTVRFPDDSSPSTMITASRPVSSLMLIAFVAGYAPKHLTGNQF